MEHDGGVQLLGGQRGVNVTYTFKSSQMTVDREDRSSNPPATVTKPSFHPTLHRSFG